ncbi:MAG: hypothetical protein ACI9GM_000328 [Salibacteraceae bacterium]|jgi:hypothetical protein
MKLKQLLFVGGLMALFTHTHTQAQQPKWNIHDNSIDYVGSTSVPIINNPNPEYTQNAVWSSLGDLLIFEVDGSTIKREV